jgi:hypothetical protein
VAQEVIFSSSGFCFNGSTVANCREPDPLSCDVIVERFQQFTGGKAEWAA